MELQCLIIILNYFAFLNYTIIFNKIIIILG